MDPGINVPVYVPEKSLAIADAFSRAPLMSPDQQDEQFEDDIQAYMDMMILGLPQLNRDSWRSIVHKKLTLFVKKWLDTVKRVGQRKDESKGWLSCIIHYHQKFQSLVDFFYGIRD